MNEPKVYDVAGTKVILYEGELYGLLSASCGEDLPVDDAPRSGVSKLQAMLKKRKALGISKVAAGGGIKVRKCGNCGEPGHQARTCPNVIKEKDEDETDVEE